MRIRRPGGKTRCKAIATAQLIEREVSALLAVQERLHHAGILLARDRARRICQRTARGHVTRRGLEHAQLGFHETGQVLLARAPTDLGVAAKRAHARARSVHEDEREHAVGHDVVKFERIAGEGLGHHDAVLLCALLKQARLIGVVVDGDVLLDLRPVLAAGVGLQQDGLRGAAGADLEHAFGLLIGQHVGGHHLRGCVGDQDLALVELARKRGDQHPSVESQNSQFFRSIVIGRIVFLLRLLLRLQRPSSRYVIWESFRFLICGLKVPGTLRNHGLRAILLYLYESTKMTEAVSEIAGYLRLVLLHKT